MGIAIHLLSCDSIFLSTYRDAREKWTWVAKKQLKNLKLILFYYQEISESIDLATTAISIKPNNYDGYYARAKALMEANNLEEALIETQRALDKVKLQQKYQKVSTDVLETLSRLSNELGKLVTNSDDHYQTIPDNRHYQPQSHAETTDLWCELKFFWKPFGCCAIIFLSF